MQGLLFREIDWKRGPIVWQLPPDLRSCGPGFAEDPDSAPYDGPPNGADTPASVPLSAKANGTLARTFCAWNGASGERYMCSVFAIGNCPLFSDAVVLAVRTTRGGDREIIAATDSGGLPELLLEEPLLGFISSRGATHWHVHLLCGSAEERRAAIADLLEAQVGR